jgi:hypothetical protein
MAKKRPAKREGARPAVSAELAKRSPGSCLVGAPAMSDVGRPLEPALFVFGRHPRQRALRRRRAGIGGQSVRPGLLRGTSGVTIGSSSPSKLDHRKMQKTVYRVRTRENISNRIALDMLRDAQAEGRNHTTRILHLARDKS